jgi:hypothetical protein
VTAVGLVFSSFAHVLLIMLIIITVLSWYTVVERMLYARRNLKA